MTLHGTVGSGRREAAGFLAVPWVSEQLREKTGLVPYPGTLNVRLNGASALALWQKIRETWPGQKLRPPDPAFCDATCFPVRVNGRVRGAVVLPHVEGYPPDLLEVVAEERLRDALDLADGDGVSVTFSEVSL